jgi:aminoglycoside 2'-N-acetyltransferase I
MVDVVILHTSQLAADTRAAARELLYAVFDDMTEHDWEHSLGGLHALVMDGARVVGHAAIVQRRLLYRGRALRAGYVEGVAVHPEHRRRGYCGAMMAVVEGVARRAYDVAALGATDEAAAIYVSRGWQLWQGPSWALTPSGIRRTEDDDGAVHVLPLEVELDVRESLTCDWRDGDVW